MLVQERGERICRMRPELPDHLRDYPEWDLTQRIIAAFFESYNTLGYGHLESVYRRALAKELRLRDLEAVAEAPVEVWYKGEIVGNYRLDLLVEGRVAVEVKSTRVLGPADKRQLLNYLCSSVLDVGLLLHYGPDATFHRVVSPRVIIAARDRKSRRSTGGLEGVNPKRG
jgi:GxxExxY protein